MDPLSPGLNFQGFDFRGSPNLLSALRSALPATDRLLSPGALALNLGDVLDPEDPAVGQFLAGLASPGPPSAFNPAIPALQSLLPPAPPLQLGPLGTAANPLRTSLAASGQPIMIDTETQTHVDMGTQTSPSPVKKTAPAPSGGAAKRSRGRAPAAAPAASGRSGGGVFMLAKAASEHAAVPRNVARASPPPPGPPTARRKPTKPTSQQGAAKKAATAPVGGDKAAPAATKKRSLAKQVTETQAAPAKKAKTEQPRAAASESHGSAAPVTARLASFNTKLQAPALAAVPAAVLPITLRLKGVEGSSGALPPSRGTKALSIARDVAPATGPKRSSAKAKPTAALDAGRPELFKPTAITATAPGPTTAATNKNDNPYATVVCEVCNEGEPEETMLLCDGCDRGFHGDCLRPAVHTIPKGAWFCCPCRRAARRARDARAAAAKAAPPAAKAAPAEKSGKKKMSGAGASVGSDATVKPVDPKKAAAAKRRHIPLPPGKLRRTRRAELQVLVYLGARVGQDPVPERDVRSAHGNNPDISKAVRALLAEKRVERFGEGTKTEPFTYQLVNGAAVVAEGMAAWKAELDADAAACAAEEAAAGEGGADEGTQGV